MRTSSDGISAVDQLRWDAASALGAIHPRMLGFLPRPPGPPVYQYHIRKSAGTSLVFAFFALGGEDPAAVEARLRRSHFTTSGGYVFVEHDKRLIGRGRYTFGSSHLPAWDVDVPPGAFTVTVLRDPVDRVVSLYRYLQDEGSDAGYAFSTPGFQRRWAADGFDRFLDRIPPFHLRNQVHMFSRTGVVDEAVDRVASLSCVLRTEHFGRDIGRLGEELDLQLVPRSERRATAASEPVSQAQMDRLREELAPEYQLLDRLDWR